MTEKVQPSKPITAYEAEDIERWWAATGARSECASCGRDEWQVFVGTDFGSVGIPTVHWLGNLSLNQHVRLLGMMCGHCAFVRFYHLNAFIEWLEQNPRKAQS